MFRSVIQTATNPKLMEAERAAIKAHRARPTPTIEAGAGRPAVVAGDRIAVETEGAVLVMKPTGDLERVVAVPNPYALYALGGSLVAVASQDLLRVIDTTTGAVLDGVESSFMPATGKTLAAILGRVQANDVELIDVWDVQARKRKVRIQHTSSSAMTLSLADGERVVVGSGSGGGSAWSTATGEHLFDFPGSSGTMASLALSTDGHYAAWGGADFDKSPPVGTTTLFDRQAKKVIATSHVSHYPTGFAFAPNGKWLAAGDLRKACLLTVPRLSLVACSAEVRPHAGFDDDLQDAWSTFVAASTAVVIVTGDGSALVASSTHHDDDLERPRRGVRRRRRLGVPRRHRQSRSLRDWTQRRVERTQARRISSRPRRCPETHPTEAAHAALLDRLDAVTCHVGDRVFPLAACDHV